MRFGWRTLLCLLAILVPTVGRALPKSHVIHSRLRVQANTPTDVSGIWTRIINGAPAGTTEYPALVALFKVTDSGFRSFFCGGALIDRSYVLTAAHCVSSLRTAPEQIGVSIGTSDISRSSELTLLKVSGVIPYPEFDIVSMKNDLALLKLEREADAASMRVASSPVSDERAIIAGWGSTNSRRVVLPGVLQHAQVPIRTDAECTRGLGALYNPSTMRCAGVLSSSRRKVDGIDTCYGDSGGPLMVREQSGALTIVGVTSWGLGCALSTSYGVYTRIEKYSSWIASPQPIPPYFKGGVRLNGKVRSGNTVSCAHAPLLGDQAESVTYEFIRLSSNRRSSTLVQQGSSSAYLIRSSDVKSFLSCKVIAQNSGGKYVLESSAVKVSP